MYNGFNEEKYKKTVAATKNHTPIDSNAENILYYAGRFHEHRLDAVNLLFSWMAKDTTSFVFKAHSLGPEKSNEHIRTLAKKYNISHKVHLLPPASSAIIYKELYAATALVLFEDVYKKQGIISQGTMPGKFFEYLPFHAPILVINRADTEMKTILEETRRGTVAHDAASLRSAMQHIREGAFSHPNEEEIKNYSRAQQAQLFCDVLDSISPL